MYEESIDNKYLNIKKIIDQNLNPFKPMTFSIFF